MFRLFLIINLCFLSLTVLHAADTIVAPNTVEEVTIVEVINEGLPRTADYYGFMKEWQGRKVLAKVAPMGVSRNLILKAKDGEFIGIFRTLATGGASEAMVALLDSHGFFGFPPVVRIKIKTPTQSLEGYIQKYEKPSATDWPSQKKQFIQELQKLIILDLLIGNLDRHDGNVLAFRGRLIPIDHNFSLLGEIPKRDKESEKRVIPAEDPWMLFSDSFSLWSSPPIWFRKTGFLKLGEIPWTPESLAFIKQLDLSSFLKKIGSDYKVDRERRLAIEGLEIWLKVASQAGLTPAQIGHYVYGQGVVFSGVPREWKRLDEVVPLLNFEDAFRQAAMGTLEPVGNPTALTYNESYHAAFLSKLNAIFGQAVKLLKGSLDPRDRDQYLMDEWLNIFERHEAVESARFMMGEGKPPNEEAASKTSKSSPDLQSQATPIKKTIDYVLLRDILKRGRELALKSLQVTSGSVAEGFKNLQRVEQFLFIYVSTLTVSMVEKNNLEGTYQFLQEQLANPKEFLIPSVVFGNGDLMEMATMPREDVKLVIFLTKSQAKQESEVYQEPLGTEWMQFITGQVLNQKISVVQDLRASLNEGKITPEEFDRKVEALKREAVGPALSVLKSRDCLPCIHKANEIGEVVHP